MGAGKQLAVRVFVPDEHGEMQAFGPGDDVPAWAVKQITNPAAWGDDADEVGFGPGGEAPGETGTEPDGDSAPDYSKLKKDELEAEVEKRNGARDEGDRIEVGGTGTKADLIAALEADDQAGDE